MVYRWLIIIGLEGGRKFDQLRKEIYSTVTLRDG